VKKPKQEYGWVIEAGWTAAPAIEYWCGVESLAEGITHQWLKESYRAVRFAREEDAGKVARNLVDPESYRIVEHAWTPQPS
jgi:hypothetical protein